MEAIVHVTTTDPQKSVGGVSGVVKNLAEGHRVRFYNASGIWGVVKAYFLAQNLKKENHKVIQFHDSIAAYFYLKSGGKAKTIYTSHGHWTSFFETSPARGFFSRMKAKALIKFQNYTTENVDVTVAVSNKIKEIIEKNSKPRKILVVYNGVDTKTFRPMKMKREGAIWVGKDPYRKRLDKTIDYCKKHNLKLTIVGMNTVPFDTTGLQTEILNNLSDKELSAAYNKAKILPFFSEQEGHPLVVLEAMACGCDIIASKNSNLEIIPMKGDFYRISGNRARKIAEKYDWNVIRKQYEKLYFELLSEALK